MTVLTYKNACIMYLEQNMECAGYRDYLIAELEKLDKIEQIIDDCDLEAWEVLKMIREVLNG